MIFGESIFPGSPISKKIIQLDFFLDIFPRDQLKIVVTLTNAYLKRMIFPEITRWEVIKKLSSYFNHAL